MNTYRFRRLIQHFTWQRDIPPALIFIHAVVFFAWAVICLKWVFYFLFPQPPGSIEALFSVDFLDGKEKF